MFQLVSIVEQGIAQHHFPANDIFETMSICALAVITRPSLASTSATKRKVSRSSFPAGLRDDAGGGAGNPVTHWSKRALRSSWLIVHIVLSLLAYAALLFTAVAAVVYLLQERQLKSKNPSGIYRCLPPLGMLDDLISRSLGAGFVFITVSMIVISVWAFVEHRHGVDWR